MYVIATLEHAERLKMTIAALERKGIRKEDVQIIPVAKPAETMETEKQQRKRPVRHVRHADTISLHAGTMLMVGIVFAGFFYGLKPNGTQIHWGIAGTAVLICLCVLAATVLLTRMIRQRRRLRALDETTEVVLMIRCKRHQWFDVRITLQAHGALELTRFPNREAK